MRRTKKPCKKVVPPVKRHIEDVPFYRFTYQPDDLPLDPAKEFLLEKISRMQEDLIVGSCNAELNFYSYKEVMNRPPLKTIEEEESEEQRVEPATGRDAQGARTTIYRCEKAINDLYEDCFDDELDVDVEDIDLPRKFDLIKERTVRGYSFETSDIDCYPWLDDEYPGVPSEETVFKVTDEILRIYMLRRVRVFHEDVRTKSPLFSNELQRLHGAATDMIGSFYTPSARTMRVQSVGVRKKTPRFKAGDHYALRTTEELKAELTRMGGVIEKLIEPVIKKAKQVEAERRANYIPPKPTKCGEWGKKSTKNTAKVQPKRRPQLSKEEFMKSLKQKDRESFKYNEGFLPVDPEEQKAAILKRYHEEMNRTTPKFTFRVQRRTLSLMDRLSITRLECYPSNLIKKILPKINKKISYLQDAYQFILKEEKHWPHIFPEVILMDFLFNSEPRIDQEAAILILSSLIDLQEDFRFHVKRALLRYILKSELERKRLQLEIEPPEFPIMTIRAPVPWKALTQIARNRLDEVLMINHPVLECLNILWHQLYNDILIVNVSKLYESEIPMNADEILEFIRSSCLVARDILLNDWVPRTADMLDALRNTWKAFIPMNSPCKGKAGILFNCVHALMSLQLRGLIRRSLDYLLKSINSYRDGNEMREYDMFHPKLKRRPFMTIVVSVIGQHFEPIVDIDSRSTATIYQVDQTDPQLFTPNFDHNTSFETYFPAEFILKNTGKMFVYPYMRELPDLFIGFIKSILRVGYNIPRLEYFMSHEHRERGFLHCIDETHVDMLRLYEDVREIVEANWTGPTVYLRPIYEYYFPLLTRKMLQISEKVFAQRKIPELPAIEDLMVKLRELVEGTYALKDFVPLNLFMLDNRHVNLALAMLVQDVINFITNYFMTLNLNENRRICDELEEMSMKAGERPEETAGVVALQNYLNDCRDERIFKIKDDIKIVAKRVQFLLQYTTLSSDDIRLNSRTFLLPSELELVLELSAARLTVVRDNLEVALREKRALFEKFIASEKIRMDGFRMKETNEILTLEELKEKVDTVNALYDTLEKCSREAKAINVDEGLLQIDISVFPKLTQMVEKMEPIEKMWKTAYEFENNHDLWMYGPFENLNADAIREEVENMAKVIHKLGRQLSTNAVAKRVTEQLRVKLDKFKVFIPVLDAICRQGLEQRHWDIISKRLHKPMNPQLYPSLKDMVDANIMSILPELEEVGNAAGKEYELNCHLVAMQREWEDVKFEIVQYRDSDTHILSALDDIQTILDDQVMKSQAMRRSPFIVALGTKADDWEAKLITMLDIMDAWTQVQATWMYLEPIFSSEDIMRQMPVEGRNFKTVDKIWRKVMKHTYQHRGVIEATDYPNLLQVFRKALEDLECVQKGLNTYLEQKRLFFARFFFLSNDELLEILSETKDPLRVQPHLKKCFEGIECLTFDDNLEIGAMISAENEVVKLSRKINPQLANGLVELWLKEVEIEMLESVQDQMKSAWEEYYQIERKSWVTSCPGQVAQGISCMAWTYEVEESIEAANIPGYLEKCNLQIGDLVQLVRTELSSGSRITVEALIVLDVHARDVVKFMIDQNVAALTDFDWISQLRYYWKTDSNRVEYVCVSMVVTDVKYGMEYLGNISRLVVTPLTDRCFRTLMGALKLCLGGAPEGPAGTGKTETCKDLAKSVAKKCVVFNCSDGLDYKALGKFFKKFFLAAFAVISAGVAALPADYLPPLQEVIEPLQYLAPEIQEEPIILADDGYRYKTVKKLRLRHRREVGGLLSEYLPPVELSAVEELPLESGLLADDGYRYKAVKKLRLRHRREVGGLLSEYLPPVELSAVEELPLESGLLADDGYRYKTVKKLRRRRSLGGIATDYLPPVEENILLGGIPEEPILLDGYRYKTVRKLKYRQRH